MSAVRVVWSLLIDDWWLALPLLIVLFIAGIAGLSHQGVLSALLIWGGLIVSLFISIRHETKLKTEK